MKRTLICLAALALMALHATAQNVPPLINYQGLLADASGDPLASGSYDLVFSIYASQEAVTPVWGPEAHEEAQVVQGRFNVILGSSVALGSAFSGPDRWLGVAVSPEAEIMPRQRVLSAPYAMTSENGAPAGAMMAYAGAVAPEGWLLCDGSEISRAEYPDLFAMIGTTWGAGNTVTTFNLPDLRGRFVRGLDSGAGYDPGRALGTGQGDSTALPNNPFTTSDPGDHNHEIRDTEGIGWIHGAAAALGLSTHTPTTDAGSHTHTIGGGDAETRPVNVAVNWIIKY